MKLGYPVVLDVEGRRCLVLGSGREAEEKAASLEECGAAVERRALYEPGCLDGVYLVVAAGLGDERNERIFEEAEKRGVLVNCLDDPAHSRFIYPSVMRRGLLSVSVSTEGACPALSVRLKERLEGEFGEEYAEFLELARRLRADLAQTGASFNERRRRWYEVVDGEALALLREGRRAEAMRLMRAILLGEALT